MSTPYMETSNWMPPPGARILIAMSGGVDSTAAAVLLAKQGYACMGVTLRMTPDSAGAPGFDSTVESQSARDARRICDCLGIPHRTVDVMEQFQRCVIDYFTASYAAGRTPNPCIRCNRTIKFGLLFHHAREWGYDFVATGHYVRLEERNNRRALRRSVYRPKDQSYVLAPLSQAQLHRACFPLGSITKEEARAITASLDVAIAAKSESQEICFVDDGSYARIVEDRHGCGKPGPICTVNGAVLGRHNGLHHYTVGQRRGLGISAEYPLYVIRLDVKTNAVIVGRDEESLCGNFTANTLFWGSLMPQTSPFRGYVQIRYRHEPVSGSITPMPHGADVHMDIPQRAVTPGQWAVYYDDAGYVLAASEIADFVSGI